ncbi:MAG: inosine/xanthosine triphosphatase [Candidatus Verstraetearchaeota archaeon]|nr:inosine/xanthosine triphosphatase [Candidatus Verstraetearchaeota archaeon]
MIVAVGSTNPVKAKAVRNVLSIFYPELEVIVKEVDPEVPLQPVGIEETIRGAVTRAKKALESDSVAELGVGVEAGLIKVPGTISGYMDQQFAAVADRQCRVTLGGGPSFEYPMDVIRRVLSGQGEIGTVMEALTGIRGLGRGQGAVGYFSKGVLDRTRLTELAVLMAMIPRINAGLYL